MFRLVEVRPYKDEHGKRLVFVAEAPVFLRRGRGLSRVLVPEGGRVEVSLVNLPPTLGGLEAAIIYNDELITLYRGLTAEEALAKTVA